MILLSVTVGRTKEELVVSEMNSMKSCEEIQMRRMEKEADCTCFKKGHQIYMKIIERMKMTFHIATCSPATIFLLATI